jgi:hypothetical protein
MDAQELEQLLWQGESQTLDFKRQQYRFDHATEEDRSEILKDILAFANSWRTTAAHIIIGVEEVQAGRANVVGTSDHILNRTLQTFVGSRVNRPLSFSYETVLFESKSVDVITIPVQERPFFLKKPFGILQAEKIYIRRGDTTTTADPTEVFQMGATRDSAQVTPILEFEFADRKSHTGLGLEPSFDCQSVEVPTDDEIPDYGANTGPFRLASINGENEEYYRDWAEYLRETLHLKPLSVSVVNQATVTAQQVVIRLRFTETCVEIIAEGDRVAFPSKNRMGRMMRVQNLAPRGVHVSKFREFAEVTIELGDIQPGTTAWAGASFFIGSRVSCAVPVEVMISGHNIPVPLRQNYSVSLKSSGLELDLDKFLSLVDELEEDGEDD